MARSKHILVIGGGASGVLMAVHLLRRPHVRVTLVERRVELGAGIAYGTSHPDHLLNVRAANMSAFPDDPQHFWRWATNHQKSDCPDAETFAPRRLYRAYLAHLLAPYLAPHADARLKILHNEVTHLAPTRRGVEALLLSKDRLYADKAVLATGNEGPPQPVASWRFDGWLNGEAQILAPDKTVVIVGTGLTMADRVLSLLHGGHQGPIVAISRRGLKPQPHGAAPPLQINAAGVPFGAGIATLMRWLRGLIRAHTAAGGDWRGVVDGLRPHTQALWRGLPLDARRRFLRHARPWWDSHRHRMAPSAARTIAEAEARGQLTIVAGRVERFEPEKDHVTVHYSARGKSRRIAAQAVFECRGRADNIAATANPIIQMLFASGQARPDALSFGLDVAANCALIGVDGEDSDRLYALGPVTAGVFWEIVAVPDIRRQAVALATALVDEHELVY
ncbi:FAD/NAD(P)-binding protein [Methylovirgula sp. 4M-Z18]|uniref:FAD/NAD(P)-binding protein n=1 Tax=Methylovirgula sp. 4M-Z18 TaxID=2293567 RepID=UPI000E2EF23D|nr:FAD/NAD(P)-binding protein [Methylovirgula sp. 4M-Z18]RFB78610.1 FAD-dependent oxidoreductase [Methylovirgula sp. 4M-Z18]